MPRSKRHRKQAAGRSNAQNRSSRPENRNHRQYSGDARLTVTVPPNISFHAGTLATITEASTIIAEAFPSSSTHRNISNTITMNPFPRRFAEVSIEISDEVTAEHSVMAHNEDVIYLYSVDSRPAESLVIDLTEDTQVSIVTLPITTNEGTGGYSGNKNKDDDIIYLYSVDSGPAQSLAEEVDLTQESQDNRSTGNVQVTELGDLSVMTGKAENTGLSQNKDQKNRKRKIQDDGANKKRKMIDDKQPICSLCNNHKESLNEIEETMFAGNCGHLFCAPCTREINFNVCGMCGKKINALRKVFF